MLAYISVIKRIASAGVLMYPEINERVSIVNAGWFMSTLWAAVKPFLPKRTENKIRIMSNGFAETISTEIKGGYEALPDFLGGKLAAVDHGVCPALSVDDAYAAITDDICAGVVEYSDSEEFLAAALSHARNLSSTSDYHRSRVLQIESYLNNNKQTGGPISNF